MRIAGLAGLLAGALLVGGLRAQGEKGWSDFEKSMKKFERSMKKVEGIGRDLERMGEAFERAADGLGGDPGELPPPPVEPAPEPESGGWGGTLFFLFLLGAGGAGFFWWRRRASSVPATAPEPVSVSAPTAITPSASVPPSPSAPTTPSAPGALKDEGTRVLDRTAPTRGGPAAEPAGEASGGELPGWLRAILSGKAFERYADLVQLGAGGMGVVVGATDTRLGRKVALKVPPPHLAGMAEFRARFLREARALARLDHPNIGSVYDVTDGESGDCPVMIMEFLEGRDLHSVVTEDGLPDVAVALDWIRQAGSGLAYVHEQEILHRDVKPANLMLVGSKLKILDFGLASLEDGTRLTRTGHLGGSVITMPPEQLRGETVDRTADVYALAATGFWLLTGKLPFDLEDRFRREVPRLSERRASVPAGLDPVFQRAMAPEREERYPDMGAFLEALEAGVRSASHG